MEKPGPPLSNAEDVSSLLMYPRLLLGTTLCGDTGLVINRGGMGLNLEGVRAYRANINK